MRRGLAPAAGGPQRSCAVLPAQVHTQTWLWERWDKVPARPAGSTGLGHAQLLRMNSSPSFHHSHLHQPAAAQSICVHLQTLRHALRFRNSNRS